MGPRREGEGKEGKGTEGQKEGMVTPFLQTVRRHCVCVESASNISDRVYTLGDVNDYRKQTPYAVLNGVIIDLRVSSMKIYRAYQ